MSATQAVDAALAGWRGFHMHLRSMPQGSMLFKKLEQDSKTALNMLQSASAYADVGRFAEARNTVRRSIVKAQVMESYIRTYNGKADGIVRSMWDSLQPNLMRDLHARISMLDEASKQLARTTDAEGGLPGTGRPTPETANLNWALHIGPVMPATPTNGNVYCYYVFGQDPRLGIGGQKTYIRNRADYMKLLALIQQRRPVFLGSAVYSRLQELRKIFGSTSRQYSDKGVMGAKTVKVRKSLSAK